MAEKLCYKIILNEEIDGDIYERTMIVFTDLNEAREFMKNYAVKAGFISGTSGSYDGEKNIGIYYYKQYEFMNIRVELCEVSEIVDECINECNHATRLNIISDIKSRMNKLFHECMYSSKNSINNEDSGIPF
ncbi:hypothetical protein [Clostridium estertheticum]|uniref:hypothetical protein n=1 Tax=Clostridium estertheticum TaxID=238834 RepID=UPI001C0ADB41|nr:hypothetical protein [Clostridium estertheticum]MBU3173700.1 hypothetical protein [Clostridium estertheticum]